MPIPCPVIVLYLLTSFSARYVTHQNKNVALRCFSSKYESMIINAVGTDRLGIVSDMTKYVTDVGGNVGESQAAKLGNYFSLMMLVQIPQDKTESLLDQLKGMEDLTASVHHVSPSEEKKDVPMHPQIGCE